MERILWLILLSASFCAPFGVVVQTSLRSVPTTRKTAKHPCDLMNPDLLSEILLLGALVGFLIACVAIAVVALHSPSP